MEPDTFSSPAAIDSSLPILSAHEARILGCLIEKEATTPEAYPLTANAVLVACNQTSNREPVLALEPGDVGHALREMEGKRLVKSIHGARVQRYEHRFAQAYSVTAQQQALLAMLLLRGPQTVAELYARCERLTAIADHDELRQTLERLMQRSPALALKLDRAAGQREDRYMHLLCGPVDGNQWVGTAKTALAGGRVDLEARIEALEADVGLLRRELDELRSQSN